VRRKGRILPSKPETDTYRYSGSRLGARVEVTGDVEIWERGKLEGGRSSKSMRSFLVGIFLGYDKRGGGKQSWGRKACGRWRRKAIDPKSVRKWRRGLASGGRSE